MKRAGTCGLSLLAKISLPPEAFERKIILWGDTFYWNGMVGIKLDKLFSARQSSSGLQ